MTFLPFFAFPRSSGSFNCCNISPASTEPGYKARHFSNCSAACSLLSSCSKHLALLR